MYITGKQHYRQEVAKHKGPEVGMNLECLRIRQKASMAVGSELRL